MTMRLTDEQKSTFERDGVICVRGALNPSEIEGLQQAVQMQLDGLGQSGTGYDFEHIARFGSLILEWTLAQPNGSTCLQ